MYGCSTAATLAASSSSSGEVDSSDLVDSVRERVAELSGSESTSSMDPSDIEEDPGYRVSVKKKKNILIDKTFFLGAWKMTEILETRPVNIGLFATIEVRSSILMRRKLSFFSGSMGSFPEQQLMI